MAWAWAALAYTIIAILLFVPVLMGECLHRSDPAVAICDAAKHRDVMVYMLAFLATPLVAAAVARGRSGRVGVMCLLMGSFVPAILVTAANVLD